MNLICSVTLEKMALVVFITQYRVCQRKGNFARWLCLQTELFKNRSVCELRRYLICVYSDILRTRAKPKHKVPFGFAHILTDLA